MHVAAIDVAQLRRVEPGRKIQRHAARAQIRTEDLGNPLLQCRIRGEHFRVLEGRGDRHRVVVVAAHRTRPRLRVVRQAVAGAEHRLVVDAIDAAEPRRKVVEARLHPVVLRVAAAPGDDHVQPTPEIGVVEIEPVDAAAINAVHDRIDLPPEAEIQCEPRIRRPPIAEEQRVLPLTRRHQLVLYALVDDADLTEQERGVRVVEVRRLAAAQPGGVRKELELAPRIARLRLPVIEVEIVQEVAAAQVVVPFDLRHVVRDRVGALVAEDRVPAVAVPELAEEARCGGAEPELGITRIPLIVDSLIVGSGDAEHVEPEVAGIEVRSEHDLFLAGEPERRVHQQRGCDRPGLAGGRLIDLRVAAVARRIRIRPEIVRQVVDDRAHVAELGPDLMARRPVPVHFRVVVLPVNRAIFRPRVVVRVATGTDTSCVGLRKQLLDLQRDRVEHALGNLVVRKRLPPRAVGVPGQGIVNHLQRAVGVECLAEVAGPERGVGHGEEREDALPPLIALEGSEEEQFVLANRAAERRPILVRLHRQLLGRRTRIEVVRLGVQLVAVEVFKGRALELVRARLGDDGDGAAAGHALLGVEAARRHVDCVDRLGGRHVHHMIGQPDVHVRRAVGARRVVGVGLAVHVSRQRARRRVGFRIAERQRRRPRRKIQQPLEIAVPVQRHVGEIRRSNLGVHVGLVGLEQRRLADHQHRLRDRGQLHLHVDA